MSHHDPHQQFGFRFLFTTLVALMMLNTFFKKSWPWPVSEPDSYPVDVYVFLGFSKIGGK